MTAITLAILIAAFGGPTTMSTTFEHDGKTIRAIAPAAGVTTSEMVLAEGIFGIAAVTKAAAAAYALQVEGAWRFPAVDGEDWEPGTPLYADFANSRLSTDETVGPNVGVAEQAKASSATEGVARLIPTARLASTDVVANDSDDAAADGVAIYAWPMPSGLCELRFVSPTDTDSFIPDDVGADGIIVVDSDTAAGGAQLYIDEDAAVPLRCNNPHGVDLWVPTQGGRLLQVKHSATPATGAVPLFLDEDVAAADRLQFVSPTNTDAAVRTAYRSAHAV